jgi:hypothetical protein
MKERRAFLLLFGDTEENQNKPVRIRNLWAVNRKGDIPNTKHIVQKQCKTKRRK